MKIINFGSLNIDHVYKVDQFVRPGETIPSLNYRQHCGGKGLNQSLALARAGAAVFHYGKIGIEGVHLVDTLKESGVDTSFISEVSGPTGHAIIQVSGSGENSIIIEGGANRKMTTSDITTLFDNLGEEDWLLLQNEINGIDKIFKAAENHPCKVVLNPAPMTAQIGDLPLERVDIIIVNETEGQSLTGQATVTEILGSLQKKYPRTRIVLTLGSEGAVYADSHKRVKQPGYPVKAVDTTGAGDTFVGYFLTSLSSGQSEEAALAHGCKAASICVTATGAADSIPFLAEV